MLLPRPDRVRPGIVCCETTLVCMPRRAMENEKCRVGALSLLSLEGSRVDLIALVRLDGESALDGGEGIVIVLSDP